MDFNEIADICGYDMDKANVMAEQVNKERKKYPDWIDEALNGCGLETLAKQSI